MVSLFIVVEMLCYVWSVHILKYRGRADRMHQCYTHKMAGFFTQNVMLSQMFLSYLFFVGKRNGLIYQFLLKFFIQIACIKCFFKVLFDNLMAKFSMQISFRVLLPIFVIWVWTFLWKPYILCKGRIVKYQFIPDHW